MGLESGSFIATLVSTNPVGATDPKSQGDDHIRLIKKALQNSFPHISTTVEATPAELNLVVGATQGLATLSAQVVSLSAQVSLKAPLDSPSFTGTPIAPTAATSTNNTQIATTAFAQGAAQQIRPITASVGSNALTLTLNPCSLDFRSATLTDGTVNRRAVSAAISVVVPSTATLGTVNGVAARLALLAIDNAGTVEAAVVNLAGGNNLDETALVSTTAIDTSSDSNNVIYSTTARSNVPFRVVGFIDISEATAGTWATVPTQIQGAGGNSFTANQSLGYGQIYQNLVGSRAIATTYYNTTGRPIYVTVGYSATSGSQQLYAWINGAYTGTQLGSASSGVVGGGGSFIAHPGASYAVSSSTGSITGANVTLGAWSELL